MIEISQATTTTSSTKEGMTSSKTVRRTKGKTAIVATGSTNTGTQTDYPITGIRTDTATGTTT